jgi:hypothetical protein
MLWTDHLFSNNTSTNELITTPVFDLQTQRILYPISLHKFPLFTNKNFLLTRHPSIIPFCWPMYWCISLLFTNKYHYPFGESLLKYSLG